MNDASVFRDKPKQSRSAATVAYIEEATLELLDVDEAPLFTTNHIAERAGVSVGSLYRYFPDKQAILRAVVRREVRQVTRTVTRVVTTSAARTSDDLLQELLAMRVDIFGGRTKSTHMIRELAQGDAELVSEIARSRLGVLKTVHARLRELNPDQFPALTEAQLSAISEAFRVALLNLARGNGGKPISPHIRLQMLLTFFGAFAQDA